MESHGLLFDLLLFGAILTFYEVLRNKKDKIERLKEELDDYRGWTENEAAYRVAGMIRRLKTLEVDIDDINLEKLHLGQCDQKLIVNVLQKKINIASLQETLLQDVDI